MKVLFVTSPSPWPATFGGRLRQARLIEQLSARNEVRVVVLDRPPASTCQLPPRTEFIQLDSECVEAEKLTTKWATRRAVIREVVDPRPELFRLHKAGAVARAFRGLRRLAAEHDVCWVSWPFFADAAMEAWPNARVVVDYVDVGALAQGSQLRLMAPSIYKMFAKIDTMKLAWHERRIAKRAWRSVVCKAEDGLFLRQRRKMFVVPNGTDSRPRTDPGDVDCGRILFVGLMSFLPNIDAVRWFVNESLPHLSELRVQLDVVGRAPPELVQQIDDGARVHIRGFVPDLEEYYRRAAVVIAPIRLGSGTKLKVLEALAYGKALVATSEAARGLNIRHEVEYLRVDSPADLAMACRRLLGNPALREQLGHAGRQRVEEMYTWDRVGRLAQQVVTP